MVFIQSKEKFIEGLSDYHRISRRKKFEKKGITVGCVPLHSVFHNMLVPVIKLLRKARKQQLIVLGDKRKKTENPIIYAVTHIGGNDVEIAFEAIRTPAWLFLGDPKELYCNFDGLMLALNGVICVETRDKFDRQIARRKAVELLKKEGNLVIYPEGAWNISDNLPVLPIYAGALEMAVEAQADIVPMAIEVYGNTYYVNIGENLAWTEINLTKKSEAALQLRDRMATLKWDEFETQGIHSRDSIPYGYRREFVDRIMNAKATSYVEQDVYDCMYRPKGITEPEEVFRAIKILHMDKSKNK